MGTPKHIKIPFRLCISIYTGGKSKPKPKVSDLRNPHALGSLQMISSGLPQKQLPTLQLHRDELEASNKPAKGSK